jgi:hypothetical protein
MDQIKTTIRKIINSSSHGGLNNAFNAHLANSEVQAALADALKPVPGYIMGIADSGAGAHFLTSELGVQNYDTTQKINIEIATGKICQSSGKGLIPSIGEVHVVKEFAHNLFSVPAFTAMGYKLTFNKNNVKVHKGKQYICTGTRIGNSYVVRVKIPEDSKVNDTIVTEKGLVADIVPTNKFKLYHNRLHVNPLVMNIMLKNNLAINLNITSDEIKTGSAEFGCDPCIRGKQQNRKHFKNSKKVQHTRATKPYDTLHIDVKDMGVNTIGGARYIYAIVSLTIILVQVSCSF